MITRETDGVMARIHALPGMEEFKAFADKLQTTAARAAAMGMRRVPLPNLIIPATPGSGVSWNLRLLAELIRELGMLDFRGEKDCFECSFRGEKPMERLLKRIKHAAGFYGEFFGVLGLNFMHGMPDADALETLMEYVDSRQGEVLFVFIIPSQGGAPLQRQFSRFLASRTPAEIVPMIFSAQEAGGFPAQQLQDRGFTVTPEAETRLRELVIRLSGEPGFEGYQTLQNLTDEIHWRKLSQPEETAPDRIAAADLDFILESDGYASRLHKGARRMGFDWKDGNGNG